MALYEVDVPQGLEDVCEAELNHLLAGQESTYITEGAIGVKIKDRWWSALHALKKANAVYSVERLSIPRPKALLGHENFERIVGRIEHVMGHHPPGTFYTMGLDGAGADSPVMERLRQTLSQRLNLAVSEEQGDLYLRLRKRDDAIYTGWELLVRTTPRPLATRAWRVADYHGALNGVVANVMIGMLDLTVDGILLNMGCGSGSLMIERYQQVGRRQQGMSIGIDHEASALRMAQANIEASGYASMMTLIQGDAGATGFESDSMDGIVADLPFGQAIGTHEGNQVLYPRIMDEAWRVLKMGGRFCIITHEINLMTGLLKVRNDWAVVAVRQINQRGLHPKIYLLERR